MSRDTIRGTNGPAVLAVALSAFAHDYTTSWCVVLHQFESLPYHSIMVPNGL